MFKERQANRNINIEFYHWTKKITNMYNLIKCPPWMKLWKYYIDMMNHSPISLLKINCSGQIPIHHYVWEQGGAAKKEQMWLYENLADLLEGKMWSPFLPDINLVDCNICIAIERQVGRVVYPSIKEMKDTVNLEGEYVQ
ncbi:unnamed protein product [Lepeophtheirus salmonis]|uniref:(salmon louse) hypothetical protein n=1 Tax=Lepeophtheirus salmonis TaxID=72036 RepID=A0A7R8HD92_LEPSM|nr:unnamed protein product [Lepeophtheirus salmonis]CAF3005329.1 unnamed protein product [Lepeophtheirus salmonis]